MRIRISRDLRMIRFLFVVLFVVTFFLLIYSLLAEELNQETILIEFIFLVFFCVLYYLFDKAKTVEFGEEFMYINGKKGEEIVLLKDICKIKITMTEINDVNLWKISYYSYEGVIQSVRILPRFIDNSFDRFKSSVKIANEAVVIQNWSHSFDLDQ